jgi:hypothetical protein
MRKALILVVLASPLLLLLFHVPTVDIPAVFAQTPDGEHNCPSPTAIPPYIGTGTSIFSPNQNLCLPQLAPIGGSFGPLAFIVQGVEPGVRVDSQGTIYVDSIRGVPGGADVWRWDQSLGPLFDGGPGSNGTLPFRYEGQPDNCGILTNGCANNVGSLTNLGVAPGGGDADIAVNGPNPSNVYNFVPIPNVAFVSLSLVDITAAHSTDRGGTFSVSSMAANTFPIPNPVSAVVPGDDRMWIDAFNDPSTVYMNYHDLATFNIDVQRSADGGATYVSGVGEAIDPTTLPTAGTLVGSANVAGQIRIDHSSCPSRGNLYSVFVAPDNPTENASSQPLRSVYVGVSTNAKLGLSAFLFTDTKVFTSPAGSPGATFGTNQVFPALAVDNFGFVYAVWSDQTHIFFSSSSDLGTTWTAPAQVNSDKTVGNANVFPWVAADANGHAVVVWLGDNLVGNSNDRTVLEKTCSDGTNSCWAKWSLYAAETIDGHDLVPAFKQFTASDHIIHSGTVSTGGLGGGADRNLADFFQVALDPQHRANISFADDHIASPLCTSQSPGHCADNDPQSFRTGQPYFTYQLKANPNIVTTGTCAPAPPPSGAEKITGGGQIPSVKPGLSANFGFVAQNTPPNAALSYHDDGAPGGSIDVHSTNTSVPAVTFTGNCGSSKGDAKVNQQLGYTYTAEACDNGGTGKDTFSITVSGPMFFYTNSGTLTRGNIQIHSE